MVMILVLVLAALLLIVALAIITGANGASQATTAVSVKYRVQNSAEGGENAVLSAVAANPGLRENTEYTGTLNGIAYDAWLKANNLLENSIETYTDPATGNPIHIPPYSAYLYGTAADFDGAHRVYVEAVAEPAPPLVLPQGVMNAGRNIMDQQPMPIDESMPNAGDAQLWANNDIVVLGEPSTVQGQTNAVGTNQLPGGHSGAQAVAFPSDLQVSLAARNAKLAAQTGVQLNGADISAAGTKTYAGNIYVRGNLALTQSTVTFAQGTFVYVDGNLCLEGAGQLVNANTASTELVVAGTVEVAGPLASYSAGFGQNALLLVLGKDNSGDTTAACSASNVHSVDLQLSNNSIGTIYTPRGSINLFGAGNLIGAVDAGADVLINGSAGGSSLKYDAAQARTSMSTGVLTYSSYIEY